ncbi:hypothetical protein D3OALGA1CA_4018 [Olavius algarvensis associated proteobacterium Delta 3]|nr:hypothetical protein D3OALGB2SA_3415 [Olavius algarvensis associated proteobacterium Delta 3]CAB5143798.1 hypothetical protein D3OALGA1CA_4018 [Olavius algarvensis associated proteobacterium Delta 3]
MTPNSWAKHPKERPLVVHQLITSIYERFQEENIIIPFPVQDIYLHSDRKAADPSDNDRDALPEAEKPRDSDR